MQPGRDDAVVDEGEKLLERLRFIVMAWWDGKWGKCGGSIWCVLVVALN